MAGILRSLAIRKQPLIVLLSTDAGLKRFIKDRQERHKWDDSDEADFIHALEGELDKVVRFQESKVRPTSFVFPPLPSQLT